jgi:hypothetical protein
MHHSSFFDLGVTEERNAVTDAKIAFLSKLQTGQGKSGIETLYPGDHLYFSTNWVNSLLNGAFQLSIPALKLPDPFIWSTDY